MTAYIKHLEPEIEPYESFNEWYEDFKKEMIKTIDEKNRNFSFQKDPKSKAKLYEYFDKIIEDHKYIYGVELRKIILPELVFNLIIK